MKLIKLNTGHYIIVDDSEIKEGDWYYWEVTKTIQIAKLDSLNRLPKNSDGSKKITYSTQPLDERGYWGKVMPLTLTISEIKELIGEVDVSKKAAELAYSRRIRFGDDFNSGVCDGLEEGYELGYNQALEDNKEKKYTENDLRRYHNIMGLHGNKKGEEFIQSFQPKTEWEVEWEVEIVDGKFKLKSFI